MRTILLLKLMMNLKATLTKILKDEDARLIEEFKPDEPGQAGFVHSVIST